MRMDTQSIALLALRAFVGFAFILHGAGKLHGIRAFADRFRLPFLLAAAVVYIQLIGGVLLMCGLSTPIASLAIAVTMVGAIAKCRARGEKFVDPQHHSWESAAFYLVALVVIALIGPGEYSLDRMLLR
jgi:putative oxidoreductase